MFMELSSIYFKANLLKDLLISPGQDVKMYSNDILLHNKNVFKYTRFLNFNLECFDTIK